MQHLTACEEELGRIHVAFSLSFEEAGLQAIGLSGFRVLAFDIDVAQRRVLIIDGSEGSVACNVAIGNGGIDSDIAECQLLFGPLESSGLYLCFDGLRGDATTCMYVAIGKGDAFANDG